MHIFPRGAFWRVKTLRKKAKKLSADCLDKSIEECLEAGAVKAGSTYHTSGCRNDLASTFEGSPLLIYRWTEGKWEFQEETRGE
jgi:hypothetical protein